MYRLENDAEVTDFFSNHPFNSFMLKEREDGKKEVFMKSEVNLYRAVLDFDPEKKSNEFIDNELESVSEFDLFENFFNPNTPIVTISCLETYVRPNFSLDYKNSTFFNRETLEKKTEKRKRAFFEYPGTLFIIIDFLKTIYQKKFVKGGSLLERNKNIFIDLSYHVGKNNVKRGTAFEFENYRSELPNPVVTLIDKKSYDKGVYEKRNVDFTKKKEHLGYLDKYIYSFKVNEEKETFSIFFEEEGIDRQIDRIEFDTMGEINTMLTKGYCNRALESFWFCFGEKMRCSKEEIEKIFTKSESDDSQIKAMGYTLSKFRKRNAFSIKDETLNYIDKANYDDKEKVSLLCRSFMIQCEEDFNEPFKNAVLKLLLSWDKLEEVVVKNVKKAETMHEALDNIHNDFMEEWGSAVISFKHTYGQIKTEVKEIKNASEIKPAIDFSNFSVDEIWND